MKILAICPILHVFMELGFRSVVFLKFGQRVIFPLPTPCPMTTMWLCAMTVFAGVDSVVF